MEWRVRAACRDEDPEIFFPATTTGAMFERQVATAKAICGRCPVRYECLGDAIRNEAGDGIWGGLTELERKRLAWSKRPVAAKVS